MKKTTVKEIVIASACSCNSFSRCINSFFNFEKRSGWLGWENWLTVDIFRRINNSDVQVFKNYSAERQKFDLFLESKNTGVEIKTTYIGSEEVTRWKKETSKRLTGRLHSDSLKLLDESKKTKINGLLILASVFQSEEDMRDYIILTKQDLIISFSDFPYKRWFNCSTDSFNQIGLLALSTKHSLPSQLEVTNSIKNKLNQIN